MIFYKIDKQENKKFNRSDKDDIQLCSERYDQRNVENDIMTCKSVDFMAFLLLVATK